MTEHDMRALALNLAHSEKRGGESAVSVIRKAEDYFAFLMGYPAAVETMRTSASQMTSAEIRQVLQQDASQAEANKINRISEMEMQEAMHGAFAR